MTGKMWICAACTTENFPHITNCVNCHAAMGWKPPKRVATQFIVERGTIIALANDGTLWQLTQDIEPGTTPPKLVYNWKALPELPQPQLPLAARIKKL